ncbi:hypothetical protein [Stenotrophomonas sp.]|uniref:hypothetical protein n=1 Tax=Stenotrophomonas sp. TaxID=69392 RepID=UPI0028983E6F|nr:hypothetical protein [Stenotrophomonas sp.]
MTHQESKSPADLPTGAERNPIAPAAQQAQGPTQQPLQPAPVMWWDGGERAITVREKREIEEHRESCFSIPLIPAASVGENHPVAWVIHWRDVNAATGEVHQRRSVFLHNAVADFRTIDPGARVAPLYDAPPAQCTDLGPRQMKTAPRDGTMVRLLVQFTDHATEDTDGAAWTIGANNHDHDGEDLWQFAGWCWTHDHFTEGKGTPVGWLPLVRDTDEGAPEVARG